MNSLFSMFFGRNNGSGAEGTGAAVLAPFQGMVVDDEESTRKRSRGDLKSSSGRVPTLVPTPGHDEETESVRPIKRFRGVHAVIDLAHSEEEAKESKVSKAEPAKIESPFQTLPEDLASHCLAFLGGAESRFALQCTSKQFRRISNTPELLSRVAVGGDKKTGLHGLVQEYDTPESASEQLAFYANAGNLEAIYMIGIIKSYCHQDVKEGIRLLKLAALKGYNRASYALGIALRDTEPETALQHMRAAADEGYIPALQELLPARKMKAKYGEPKADELRLHLDPLCLNRLLTRYYIQSAELRQLNTSHCWNPLCGRWAFKASLNPRSTHSHQPLGFSFHQHGDVISPSSRASSDTGESTSPCSNKDESDVRISRMKMCSRCCRAKYCSKLCQVYDWRSGRHKMECQFL